MNLDLNYYKKYFKQGIGYEEKKNEILTKELGEKYSKQYDVKINKFQVLKNSNRANIIYKNNIPITCVVDYSVKWTKTNINSLWRKVWTDHNNVFIGDVVKFENEVSKELEDFLFVSKVENMDGYDELYMQKCNNTLKWIDLKGITQEIPCIIQNETLYSDGLNETNTVTILDTKKSLIIPNNDITKELAEGQRLLFNKNKRYCYEISQIDGLTSLGLLHITLKSSAYNPSTDDLENNLCDINKLAVYEIRILSTNPSFINVGKSMGLQVELLKNGVVVTDSSILSQITYTSDNVNIATVDNTGLVNGIGEGTCNITAQYNGVSASISVNINTIVLDKYSITLSTNTGVDYVKQTRNIIINANILNNGVVDNSKTVIWNITNKNETTPCLVTNSNSTGTSITLVAGQKLGYVIVRATLNTDSNIFVEKEILVKSILA